MFVAHHLQLAIADIDTRDFDAARSQIEFTTANADLADPQRRRGLGTGQQIAEAKLDAANHHLGRRTGLYTGRRLELDPLDGGGQRCGGSFVFKAECKVVQRKLIDARFPGLRCANRGAGGGTGRSGGTATRYGSPAVDAGSGAYGRLRGHRCGPRHRRIRLRLDQVQHFKLA